MLSGCCAARDSAVETCLASAQTEKGLTATPPLGGFAAAANLAATFADRPTVALLG